MTDALALPADDAGLDALYGDAPVGVRVNLVLGLDGSTSVAGSSRALSGPADLRLLLRMRTLSDVVLVGAGTVRAEGYAGVRPRLAVVSGSGLADLPATGLDAMPPLLVTTAAGAARRREQLGPGADTDVVVAGDDQLDPGVMLAGLADHGLHRVLCEGGLQLVATLGAAGLVAELCLTVSPRVGGTPSPTAMPGGLATYALRSVRTADGFVFLRYLSA